MRTPARDDLGKDMKAYLYSVLVEPPSAHWIDATKHDAMRLNPWTQFTQVTSLAGRLLHMRDALSHASCITVLQRSPRATLGLAKESPTSVSGFVVFPDWHAPHKPSQNTAHMTSHQSFVAFSEGTAGLVQLTPTSTSTRYFFYIFGYFM